MRFKNLNNQYVEDKNIPWLWTLLFGPLYFAFCGIWRHVFIWLVIGCLAFYSGSDGFAVIVNALLLIMYILLASRIVRNSYFRAGWVEDGEPNLLTNEGKEIVQMAAVGHKQCPYCSENIRKEAIKCKHCGSKLDDELSHSSDKEQPTVSEQMEKLGITFDGIHYLYDKYRYEKLEDAINYAQLQLRS